MSSKGRGRILLMGVLLAGPVVEAQQQYRSFQQLTVDNTVRAIASTTLRIDQGGSVKNISACSARLRTAEIIFTEDGTTPTTSVGTLLEPGEVIDIPSYAIASALQFLRTGATSGQLDIRCWSNPQ